MSEPVIAIDGPSGAGKGTVARAIADHLGYRHIDSGAMYRAVAWKAVRDVLPLDQDDLVTRLAVASRIELTPTRVAIDGIDVTRAIRTAEIDRAAAAVARLPGVRAVLVERLQALGAGGGIVMEGRDIGTVVFPGADVKIYLDAAPEERARRRAADAARAGGSAGVAEIATALSARDELDRTRAASPLKIAGDAVRIDTTGQPVGLVIEGVLRIIEQHLEQRTKDQEERMKDRRKDEG